VIFEHPFIWQLFANATTTWFASWWTCFTTTK